MENSNSNIDTVIMPQSACRGDQVSVLARLKNIASEVKYVVIEIPLYGISQVMKLQNDGSYSLSYCIPYDAYSGSYSVRINVTDRNYNSIASSSFDYIVK
ncbi:hypothetical protein SDC9_143517 [bioreactor metagenome]|uniref:YtkA-like domain-containing protein n=1 Tax=bioreactor metagenome TaxID=1076179 RepID=A0A645E456_9ZZZZ|nr:hypothetical protein [Oscillospiraceae bacterium]